MQKKTNTKYNVSQEEIQERLKRMQSAKELERTKHDMETGRTTTKQSPSSIAIENLMGVGESEDSIYEECRKDLYDLINKLGNFVLGPEKADQLFPKDKIANIVNILRKSRMELEARSVMDIFKDRVKFLNNGKLPTIKEKQGMFGKTVSRAMKLEEIAAKFNVENRLPPDDVGKLGEKGTKEGLMAHLQKILFANDDIFDPTKAGPRKAIAHFLDASGIIDLRSKDPDQKFFNAVLLTPDSMQPVNKADKERLVKLRAVLKKANKWFDEYVKKAEQQTKQAEKAEEEKTAAAG
ncbi:MAG: hypothetical protein P9L94_10770 [Candidatus Hinthialibacter antarcticus]|nr:hypothetical protein [Candidatus Hinthialibacter antarcticus]